MITLICYPVIMHNMLIKQNLQKHKIDYSKNMQYLLLRLHVGNCVHSHSVQ